MEPAASTPSPQEGSLLSKGTDEADHKANKLAQLKALENITLKIERIAEAFAMIFPLVSVLQPNVVLIAKGLDALKEDLAELKERTSRDHQRVVALLDKQAKTNRDIYKQIEALFQEIDHLKAPLLTASSSYESDAARAADTEDSSNNYKRMFS